MAITVAKYTFSSWLRKGIGNQINQTDNLASGAPTVPERATIPVDVQVNGSGVHKDFSLIGPGDIIGINPQMVVRTEPLHEITNFEPNYLAFIEFYDEDFIWRYTPAKADGDKSRPWLSLLILEDSPNEETREFVLNNGRTPLPTVVVKTAAGLPAPTQTWAWGHAHFNESYQSDSEFEKFLESLHDLDNPNADKVICRLLSPRKLEVNKAYRAFVVPAFETGRLAGLGMDPAATDAQQPAWNSGAVNLEFPVYYQWYFRTGANEDFESLVKMLEPRAMDRRVGIRDMDGSLPGFGMTTGTDIGAIEPADAPQDIIGLEGALQSPSTKAIPLALDTSREFFTQLEAILNFPAAIQQSGNMVTDPVVSPPIYGENHALTHELDSSQQGWMHLLNKDPRLRVPGGFGTKVVQKNQEDYVARAWTQVKRVLDANRLIRYTSFSLQVAQAITNNFIKKLTPASSLQFFAPLLKKVKGSPTTLQYQMEESTLPVAAVSVAFRRILRPRGAYFKKIKTTDPGFSTDQLLTDLNEGKISAAPPRTTPADLLTDTRITEQYPGKNIPEWLRFLLAHNLLILLILLAVLLLAALLTGAWAALSPIAAAAIGLYLYSEKYKKQVEAVRNLADPKQLVQTIETAPPQPDFVFMETDPLVLPRSEGSTTVSSTPGRSSNTTDAFQFTTVRVQHPGAAGSDNPLAGNFRQAATAFSKRMTISAPVKVFSKFDMANAHTKLLSATDPRYIFPRLLASQVYYSFNPGWLLQWEHLVPAMAYPDFEDPMYEKLRDISPELLIPNIKLIPPNTISLLVTNPPFIESYMVGLNHEFGRELLWREYPTDQRGSYFRQFWDVKGIITNEDNLSAEALSEAHKDIIPIDKWFSSSQLGHHKKSNPSGAKQVVLVIKGELLKKYPNTIIYAQKAHIYRDKDGQVDGSKEPIIIEVASAQQMAEEIKFPLFKADVKPDIKFFGFDLTIPQARGDDAPSGASDDWGYYFVIQQIPGEPRFGMDIKFDPDEDPTTPLTWDDLAWDRYTPVNGFIDTGTPPGGGFSPGGTDHISQWGTDAARFAYILYQKPVMIAVHAKEMLENLDT
ncbi:hypothetical protein GCM10027051_08590 [Niabella terrae]